MRANESTMLLPFSGDAMREKPLSSAPSARRMRGVESFKNVVETFGPLEPGMSLFALTRGQWSMVDAIFYLIDQVGPSIVSLWPRTVAVSKGDILTRLRLDPRITFCRLVFNAGDEKRNHVLVDEWQGSYGRDSIKHCRTHAKIATVEGGGMRFLLRGSLNLGVGSRFEQCDVTEGGDDFAMIRGIEQALPSLGEPALSRVAKGADRQQAARESFGPVTRGMARLCVSWGAYSFAEAIRHILDEVGPATLSLWTWVAAARDLDALLAHPNAAAGTLLIDMDARERTRNNVGFASQWRAKFGQDSVKYIVSHAKMCLISSATHRVLLRGSANLNKNDRLEQFDITEGGPDFSLVKRVGDELPVLPDDVTAKDVYVACKVGGRIAARDVPAFGGLKVWAR